MTHSHAPNYACPECNVEPPPQPTHWWWISFANPEAPKGSQHLGVALVEGATFEQALRSAWEHGCNPGGEAVAHIGPQGVTVAEEWANRLIEGDNAKELADMCPAQYLRYDDKPLTFTVAVALQMASLYDVDDWVEDWHRCGDSTDHLRDWLGLTREQYGRWVRDATTLVECIPTL